MNVFIVILIIAILAAIIYLSGQSKPKKKNQTEFLKQLADLVDGKIEPMSEQLNSFRVTFPYQGENFIYEEIESVGFKDKVLKSYIRVKSSTNLTLTFTEKEHSKPTKTAITLGPKDEFKPQNTIVRLPPELKNFGVYTNNPLLANRLMDDPKIAALFVEFKNIDSRGYAFVTLKIIDGIVNLEFHPTGTFRPKPLFMHDNIKFLDMYLKKVLMVVRKLNEKI